MATFFKNIIVKLAIWLLKKGIDKIPNNTFNTQASLSDKQWTFLKNVASLIQYAQSLQGYKITGGELWRHQIMQVYYLKVGLSKTKTSKHQDRLAIDLNVFIDGELRTDREAYKPLAEYWKSLHPDNTSGYYWNWDLNHFQMT